MTDQRQINEIETKEKETEKHIDEMHNKTKIEQKNKQTQTKHKTEWKNIGHGRQTKCSSKQKYGV